MASKNKETGNEGEAIAEKFLQNLGFKTLQKNYRFRRNEIDLIVTNGKLMIFVEVKTRQNNHYGEPEDFVSKSQIARIQQAAEQYMEDENWNGPIRFDILSVLKKPSLDILHFEDAF